jgi:hypothetical protein
VAIDAVAAEGSKISGGSDTTDTSDADDVLGNTDITRITLHDNTGAKA